MTTMADYMENMTDLTTAVSEFDSIEPIPPTINYKDWYLGVFFWVYLAIIAGIPSNILVLVAYIKFPSLDTPTNLLICNQSVADLLFCLTTMMFVWFNYTVMGLKYASYHKYACLIMLFTVAVSLWSSVINLLALSVERFLAIAFPYHYLRWVSPMTVKNSIIGL